MSTYSNVMIKQLAPGKIQDALKVRIAVFVEEQKYAMEDEIDDQDNISLHWVAYADKQNPDGTMEHDVPVGTIRLIPKPDQLAKLGRLAVLSDARGLYIGQKLVAHFIQHCQENQFKDIVLHAQYPRRGFYQKLGFVIDEGSETFLEDGTPHICMHMRNI
ncbi:acyl-CoA N-acyltransferase [Gilbertella persicaria]|uniref:acyl-CoA N-acyltransferase n=1 Tax=Gilbertella persicaria TaxID=101096 RepID=UPI00221F472A|nr:acyl-CoA N-acyltransferase [Gilbertella persicaria]KAI8056523.1 acyl-CoA N-acyltransferase [Gilbertella persicaria]